MIAILFASSDPVTVLAFAVIVATAASPFMTIDEVVDRLRYHDRQHPHRAILELLRIKRIERIRTGRRVIVRRTDVDKVWPPEAPEPAGTLKFFKGARRAAGGGR